MPFSVKDSRVGNLLMTEYYSETAQRIDRFLERDHEMVGSAGKTIVFLHGRRTARSVVLLHGLSASPTQFIELGRALHARGYNVLAPRLPRHGYNDRLTDALGRLTAVELRQVTRESIAIARGLGDHVSVVGFSLGGLMAAWAAQHHDVDSAVCIAPFLGLAWVPSVLAWPAALLMLRLPNRFHWWHPIKKANLMPAHGYPRYATHSVAQAY
ncbi:MAG: alpha/beta fold hydrolase, partial [Candidatus Baltobacteraceae bacterium]